MLVAVERRMRISLAGVERSCSVYWLRTTVGLPCISTTINNKYFYTLITLEQGATLQIISADYRTLFRHSPTSLLGRRFMLPQSGAASFCCPGCS